MWRSNPQNYLLNESIIQRECWAVYGDMTGNRSYSTIKEKIPVALTDSSVEALKGIDYELHIGKYTIAVPYQWLDWCLDDFSQKVVQPVISKIVDGGKPREIPKYDLI